MRVKHRHLAVAGIVKLDRDPVRGVDVSGRCHDGLNRVRKRAHLRADAESVVLNAQDVVEPFPPILRAILKRRLEHRRAENDRRQPVALRRAESLKGGNLFIQNDLIHCLH